MWGRHCRQIIEIFTLLKGKMDPRGVSQRPSLTRIKLGGASFPPVLSRGGRGPTEDWQGSKRPPLAHRSGI